MTDLWKDTLLIIAKEQGIVGIVTVLSEWAAEHGGLEWVKRCVVGITQEQVDRRMKLDA